MSDFFYTEFLTRAANQIIASTPLNQLDVQKYLYITTLSRILSSLEVDDQQSFIKILAASENSASQWIASHIQIAQLVKEHLDRMTLSLKIYDTN